MQSVDATFKLSVRCHPTDDARNLAMLSLGPFSLGRRNKPFIRTSASIGIFIIAQIVEIKMDGEQGDTMARCEYIKTHGYKKPLPKAGVDPMPLAFKTSASACFRGKRDRTGGYLLSRQVGCPLHHWCYATLLQGLGYGQEIG